MVKKVIDPEVKETRVKDFSSSSTIVKLHQLERERERERESKIKLKKKKQAIRLLVSRVV